VAHPRQAKGPTTMTQKREKAKRRDRARGDMAETRRQSRDSVVKMTSLQQPMRGWACLRARAAAHDERYRVEVVEGAGELRRPGELPVGGGGGGGM